MKHLMAAALICLALSCNPSTNADHSTNKQTMTDSITLACAKQTMGADAIIRLSEIEVHPHHLKDYVEYATEVGRISLLTEPGVLTMYAVSQKDNPCRITILETYASQEAYRSHIASPHFQKYKTKTLHMVKSLKLIDQTPLNPHNKLHNFITEE